MYKFFLILISFSAYTHAWWDTGHALVCDEAYKRLSPEIQKKVDELILLDIDASKRNTGINFSKFYQ